MNNFLAAHQQPNDYHCSQCYNDVAKKITCPQCSQNPNALGTHCSERRILVANQQTPPSILALQLKRFDYANNGIKNSTPVSIPTKIRLAFNEINQPNGTFARNYILNAIVLHRGANLQFGHYMALVKRNGTWFLCDDTNVTQMTCPIKDLMLTAQQRLGQTTVSYLLFYELNNDNSPSTYIEEPVQATAASSNTPTTTHSTSTTSVSTTPPQATSSATNSTTAITSPQTPPQTAPLYMDGSLDDNLEIEGNNASTSSSTATSSTAPSASTTTSSTPQQHPANHTHSDTTPDDINSSDDEADFSEAHNVGSNTIDMAVHETEIKRREKILNDLQISDIDLDRIGQNTKKHHYKHDYAQHRMLNPTITTNQEFEATIKHIKTTLGLEKRIQEMHAHMLQLQAKAQETATMFQKACNTNNTTNAQQAVASLEKIAADATRLHQIAVNLVQSANIDSAFIKENIENAKTIQQNIQQLSAELHKSYIDVQRVRQNVKDLEGASLQGIDLSGLDLSGANLTGANLNGAKLVRTNLTGANLSNAHLIHADLTDANLSGANLSNAQLMQAQFNGTILDNAILSGADLSHATLYRAFVTNVHINQNANLSFATLEKLNFRNAIIENANFFRATLKEITFYTCPTFDHLDMTLATLDQVCFSTTSLTNIIFKGATLNAISIIGTNTMGNNLNFEDATIQNSIFLGETCRFSIFGNNKERTINISGNINGREFDFRKKETIQDYANQFIQDSLECITYQIPYPILPLVLPLILLNKRIRAPLTRIVKDCSGVLDGCQNIDSVIANSNFTNTTLLNTYWNFILFVNCNGIGDINNAQKSLFNTSVFNETSRSYNTEKLLISKGAKVNGEYSPSGESFWRGTSDENFLKELFSLIKGALVQAVVHALIQ
jgi:uncharacterized protein YjbI with pentapeptide repeats